MDNYCSTENCIFPILCCKLCRSCYDRQYRARNKNIIKLKDRVRHAVHYTENKDYYSCKSRNRDSKKRQLTIVPIKWEQIKLRISVFGNKCVYCSGPYEHLDHRISLSRGGKHILGNLVPACASCNLSKGAKSLQQWLIESGRKLQYFI